MNIPLDSQYKDIDHMLVRGAVSGDRESLEELIKRHQGWIYNIALRMVWSPMDAEDVAQEVWLKVITKLSSFRGDSEFRTWLYRITANHVINMKKRNMEYQTVSFPQYWADIDGAQDREFPDTQNLPVEKEALLEEIRIHCMTGMLLCLNRRRRLVFILGEIMGISDRIGSQIIETSPANYRQLLSRSRKSVYNFMKNKCGLVDKSNPCHCDQKARSMLDGGAIDPYKFRFNTNYRKRIIDISKDHHNRLTNIVYKQCKALFKEQPFQEPPDYTEDLRSLLQSDDIQTVLNAAN